MSKVRLYGDTSGFVDLKAPDVASNVTITLPNTTGPFATETYVDSAIAGIPGIGSNVVQAYKTNLFSTTSTSLVDVTDLTVTITPTSATAKVLVVVSLTGGAVTENAIATVLRDATAIGDSTVGSVLNGYAQFGVGTNDFPLPGTMVFLDSPATSSAVTYKVQARMAAAGTFYVNRRSANGDFGSVSSITVIEVAA